MSESSPNNELDGASLPELEGLMRSEKPGERAAAACAIGDRLRTQELEKLDSKLEETLASLLDDPATYVRFETAIAMAEIQDFRATPLLLGATRSRSLRLDAIRALGTMGDPKAIEPLREILARFFMPWADKLQAAAALCALKSAEGQDYLQQKLTSRKFAERAAAIHFMAESSHPDAVSTLIGILEDTHDPMQDVAARSLGLIPSAQGLEALKRIRPHCEGHLGEDIDEAINLHG